MCTLAVVAHQANGKRRGRREGRCDGDRAANTYCAPHRGGTTRYVRADRRLLMRRSSFVHQFNQLAEQTPADIAATLLPRGITSVYIKAIDGPYYMGDVYSHPLVPRDSASMAVLVDQFAAEGLTLVPWVVPRRQASEADVHVECAHAAGGRLIIDWEYHYAGFWEGTLAAAVEYHDTLQAAVQAGLWIASAPDPRQVGRDYDGSLIAHLSAYLPQDYWVDFQVGPIDVLADSFQKLEQYGPVEPILPHTATAADMQTGLAYCFGQGVQAVSLWL